MDNSNIQTMLNRLQDAKNEIKDALYELSDAQQRLIDNVGKEPFDPEILKDILYQHKHMLHRVIDRLR